MKNSKSLWQKIGVIGVDAGICWIGDPCYVFGDDASHRFKSWDKFCDKIGTKDINQFNYDKGHPGLGVCVSSGYGDGEYDVFAKLKNGKVKEIKVKFF